MKKINFLFCIHNHQPVGNFEHVFKKAFARAYQPFLGLLEKHPLIKATLHFSGSLLEWLEAEEPAFLETLKGLVHQGRVELMGGGFYEPIFSILREPDALGQIALMNQYLSRTFSMEPRGAWIPERVWDPVLPRLLSCAGMSYTLLDSTHFIHTGVAPEEIRGYYVTEREGKTIAVFPIDVYLRYIIPFQPPEKTIEYLRFMASEEEHIAITYGDDGEKFGMWPGTYAWVYEKGWLDRFFTELEKNSEMIQMRTFSEYLEHHPPQGQIYLPNLAYEEMMEWALPADAVIRYENMKEHLQKLGLREKYGLFIRGGYWNNFLAKYPESNQIHKKMLMVSERFEQWQADREAACPAVSVERARRELYRGQCNCPYWHGLFGGVYLNYLRHAVYEHLISAEKIMDAEIHGTEDWIEYCLTDFNKDLSDDILISGKNLNLYFSPKEGGSLFELDFKPCCFNLANTFTRKMEGYHRRLKLHNGGSAEQEQTGQPLSVHAVSRVKEEGLQRYLVYDWYQRYSFLDHFLDAATTPEAFSMSRYTERGDFINASYALQYIRKDPGAPAVSCLLAREGLVFEDYDQKRVRIEKEFSVHDGHMEINAAYVLTNSDTRDFSLWFGIELNCTLLAGDDPLRYFLFSGDPKKKLLMAARAEQSGVSAFDIKNAWNGFGMRITLVPEGDVWTFPIETVSQSDDGLERTYQGSTILLHWKMRLPRGAAMRRAVKLQLSLFPGEKERKQ